MRPVYQQSRIINSTRFWIYTRSMSSWFCVQSTCNVLHHVCYSPLVRYQQWPIQTTKWGRCGPKERWRTRWVPNKHHWSSCYTATFTANSYTCTFVQNTHSHKTRSYYDVMLQIPVWRIVLWVQASQWWQHQASFLYTSCATERFGHLQAVFRLYLLQNLTKRQISSIYSCITISVE